MFLFTNLISYTVYSKFTYSLYSFLLKLTSQVDYALKSIVLLWFIANANQWVQLFLLSLSVDQI